MFMPLDAPTRVMANKPLRSNTGRWVTLVRPFAWQAFPFLIREYNSMMDHKTVLVHDDVKRYRAPTPLEIKNFRYWSVHSTSLDVIHAVWVPANEGFHVFLTFKTVKSVLDVKQNTNNSLCAGRPHKSWISWQCEWCQVYQFHGIERPHATKCSLAIGNCQLRQRFWVDDVR